ncbi:C40 family peptidase [Halomonas sp. LS-001]
MISGCASSTSTPYANTAAPDNYFAMPLPDMPSGDEVMMSPVIRSSTGTDQRQRQVTDSTPAMVRQALLSQHQRWVGTPYRLGGTNERGIDCSALIQNVYRDTFNMELPRTTRQQVKQGRQINRSELQAGDLVFFNPPGPSRHAGIYIGDGRFMHASSSRGVMISRLDNSYWKRYYWQSRRTLEPTHLAGLGDSLRR